MFMHLVFYVVLCYIVILLPILFDNYKGGEEHVFVFAFVQSYATSKYLFNSLHGSRIKLIKGELST